MKNSSSLWLIALVVVIAAYVFDKFIYQKDKVEELEVTKTAISNTTDCRGKSNGLIEFTLSCIKNGNPMSDEEGEDLVAECRKTAKEFFCSTTPTEVVRFYDKKDRVTKCTAVDGKLLACDVFGNLYEMKD